MIQSRYLFSDTLQPVLALAIHNGHGLPESLEPYMGIDEKARRMEEDPYSDLMAMHYPNYIILESSRFAVDLNRPLHRAIYQKPEDAWGLPVRKAPLPPLLLHQLEQYYLDWYKVLKYEVDRLLSFHPFIVIWDFHNYNHRRGGPDTPADPQNENPDIILGRNNMPKEYYPYVEALREKLDGKEVVGKILDVRCDVKFPGGYLSRWLHDSFPGQVLVLAVEFKKIFMNEHTGMLRPVAYGNMRYFFYEASIEWMQELPLLKKR
ncbi:MAG: N-formylglutamate amidohydrolase [Candidatus Cloacimonadaceae bacterium]